MFGAPSSGPNTAFVVQMDVDGGGYSEPVIGASGTSRTRSLGHITVPSIYQQAPAPVNLLVSPTISGSTGTVKFKIMVTQGAGSARTILLNHTDNNSAEGTTTVSVLTAMEIQA